MEKESEAPRISHCPGDSQSSKAESSLPRTQVIERKTVQKGTRNRREKENMTSKVLDFLFNISTTSFRRNDFSFQSMERKDYALERKDLNRSVKNKLSIQGCRG